jgi:RNA binding exosome subunit
VQAVVEKLQTERAVQSVEISTIAHATDDLAKVQTALRSIIPESLREREIFTRRYLEGHHGNQIVTFDARLTKLNDVDAFTQHFMKRLPKGEKLVIERDLNLHSDDEGNLFIRVDKQQAFRGIVEVGGEDPIRVKLKFSRFSGSSQNLMKHFLESE